MTVLVGILCSDGVVIGTDSAAASSPVPGQVVMEYPGVLKIELVGEDIITATTGAVGLSQRFNEQAGAIFRFLKTAYQPPQIVQGVGFIGTPIQQILAGQFRKVKYLSMFLVQ